MSARTRARLIALRHVGGDALPGEFVRLISGSHLGIIESITGDHALVCDLSRPGHKEILPLCILMRAVSFGRGNDA